MVKPVGRALNIGLNGVDPKHYSGWSGQLTACEADADDMAQIAKSQKFGVVKKLLTKQATRSAVEAEIKDAAGKLESGALFLLTYSGHGGQLPDLNNDEDDGQDETWCLYDGELIDDELYALLGQFKAGVRILVFSDSCHSGSVLKAQYYREIQAGRAKVDADPVKYRFMPPDVALRTYRDNKEFYDPLLKKTASREAQENIKASALLISGCQDNQTSSDGAFNGLFTGKLLRVWNNGHFKGDYKTFWKSIGRLMPPDQTPNYYKVGAFDIDFEKQKPFTV